MRKLVTIILILMIPSFAWSQTPIGGDDYPPLPGEEVETRTVSPSGAVQALDPASAEQAAQQFHGDYPPLQRTGGGLIQESWNDSEPHQGVHQYLACERCVFKIRTREFMTTTIKLPEGEEITAIDVGDPGHFKVRKQGVRIVALKPMSFGNDTSLIVYGKSGRVYPFYVRSEGYNSNNIPDLLVIIEGNGFQEYAAASPTSSLIGVNETDIALGPLPSPPLGQDTEDEKNHVREIAFDPSKIKGFGDYRVSGNIKERPKVIFRDDQFTYIQFENWDGAELPTAYVVYDGIDELVNTRIMGKTYIVESVSDVISLKSGNKYLCIAYKKDEGAIAMKEYEK